jgi:hypothetical protein
VKELADRCQEVRKNPATKQLLHKVLVKCRVTGDGGLGSRLLETLRGLTLAADPDYGSVFRRIEARVWDLAKMVRLEDNKQEKVQRMALKKVLAPEIRNWAEQEGWDVQAAKADAENQRDRRTAESIYMSFYRHHRQFYPAWAKRFEIDEDHGHGHDLRGDQENAIFQCLELCENADNHPEQYMPFRDPVNCIAGEGSYDDSFGFTGPSFAFTGRALALCNLPPHFFSTNDDDKVEVTLDHLSNKQIAQLSVDLHHVKPERVRPCGRTKTVRWNQQYTARLKRLREEGRRKEDQEKQECKTKWENQLREHPDCAQPGQKKVMGGPKRQKVGITQHVKDVTAVVVKLCDAAVLSTLEERAKRATDENFGANQPCTCEECKRYTLFVKSRCEQNRRRCERTISTEMAKVTSSGSNSRM